MKKHRKTYISKMLRRAFRAAFFTMTVTEFTQISALLIDGMIVSRNLGGDEIAAVGFASPLFFFIGILGTGFASGLQTLSADRLGRGKVEEVKRLLSETLLVALIISLLFFALTFAFAPQLAFLFGARGKAAQLLGMTSEYLRGVSLEYVPYVLMSILIPAIDLDDGGRIVVISSVCAAVSDVVFDIIAVKAGLGVWGVGLATSASTLIGFLCLLPHFFKKSTLIRPGLTKPRGADILAVLRSGLPKAVHSISGMLCPIVLNPLTVAVGGNAAMTAMSIRGNLSDFVEIPIVGLAGAVGILAGVSFGEQNGEELENISLLSHRYLAIISGILTLGLIVLAGPIARFYLKADNPALPLLVFAVRAIAVGLFFTGLIQMRIGYLQALQYTNEAQLVEAAANLFLLLACAFALSAPFGIYGIFAAFPVSKLMVLLIIYLLYARKSGQLPPQMQVFLKLDGRFYPDVSDIIEYPVEDREQCVLAARQLYLFATGHGIEREKAYFAALCAEEITTNIIEHGFLKRGGEHLSEIRVTLSEGNIILRVRDNGVAFNIKKMAEILVDNSDPLANTGIRMITATAKRVTYYRSWGSNVAIIVI